MATGTVEKFAFEVGKLLAPLQQQMTPAQVLDLFSQLGLRPPPQLLAQAGFANAAADTANRAGQLPAKVTALANAIQADNAAATVGAAADLIAAASSVVDSFQQLRTTLNAVSGLPGVSDAELHAFATLLPERLLDYLLVTYLQSNYSVLVALLESIGIVELSFQQGVNGDPAKPPYTLRRIHFDQVALLLSNPVQAIQNLYGWNSGGFDGVRLLLVLKDVAFALGLPAALLPPAGGKPLTLDLGGFKVFPRTALSPRGIEIDAQAPLPDGTAISLPLPRPGWALELNAHGTIPADSVVLLQPPAALLLTPPSGQLSGLVKAAVTGAAAPPAQRLVLFGQTGGTRLEAAQLRVAIGGEFIWDAVQNRAHGELLVEGSIRQGKFVLSLAGADGFLSKLLPAGGVDFDFDFGIGWSQQRGVYVTGSAGLETTIGLHASIGPFTLESLHIALAASAPELTLETTITGAGQLGPVSATVDQIGLLTHFQFKRGNLGPVNAALSFRPPSGVGIAVDAGAIVGGGYLFVDAAHGRYAGVLELKLYTITVKAIGLIDTRLPDGTPGFSFLIIITTDFIPIQLGFGFTLSGVGGLAGINRTMILDVLRAGLRNHTLNSVLFPDDPIHNAPRIISDLRGIFPPADQRYVFGPMLKFGWGTPNLISASFGMILELPAPVRLAILGQIKAALPTEDVALIELHMDVLGAIDFGARKLAIDASLYDSRILIYSVFGDMALRLDWGDDPSFALSVGGLHPRFQPPPGFPSLRRMTVSVGLGSNPRFSIDSYYAITSNSLQFGAHAELYVGAFGFALHGWIGWDALFILSPFGFVVEIRAGIDISYEGVSLAGIDVDVMLAGPTPWDFNGQASFHILFFEVGMHVHVTFGPDRPPALPKKKVMEPLVAALSNPQSWTAVLPDGSERAVSLAGPQPNAATVVVHPLGSLTARQTVVPLRTPINKFAHASPADGDSFEIASATINGQPQAQQDQTDMFARAQFQQMSDADTLAARPYERFPSGVTVGSSEAHSGHDSMLEVRYETIYVPDPFRISILGLIYALPNHIHIALAQQGAGALSPVLTTGLAAYTPPGTVSAVSTADPGYVVASTEDLSVRFDLTAEGTSQHMAQAALRDHLAQHPEDAGLYQVIPAHEAVAP